MVNKISAVKLEKDEENVRAIIKFPESKNITEDGVWE